MPILSAAVGKRLSRNLTRISNRNWLYQRAHLLDASRLHMTERHSHHNRQRQPHTGFHFGMTPDKVLFKTEAIVDAVVDAFQGTTTSITTLPRGAAVRRRYEDTPILLRDVNADNAPIVARV